MNTLPSCSIIVPSLNKGEFIADTLQSLINGQSQPEILVMDGGSTDSTLDVLRSCSPAVPYISDPDNGQADAINQGIARTTGDIIAWLNADDLYFPETITRVRQLFAEHPEIDVIYGDAVIIDAAGDWVADFPHNRDFDRESLLAGHAWIPQPAVFWRRRLLARVGLLDPELHYAMDYEYWCRLVRANITFFHDPVPYAAMRYYPQTKTATGSWPRYREIARVCRRVTGRPLAPLTIGAALDALAISLPRPLHSLFNRSWRIYSGLRGNPHNYGQLLPPFQHETVSLSFPIFTPTEKIRFQLIFAHRPATRVEIRISGSATATLHQTKRSRTIELPLSAPGNLVTLTLRTLPATAPKFRVLNLHLIRQESASGKICAVRNFCRTSPS